MSKKWTLFDYINAFFMLIVLCVTLYPMLYIVSVSFSDTVYILQNKVRLLPRGFNIEAYKMIFTDVRIPRAYLNTIIYTTVGTFINLFMTSLAAYPLARKTFFGRKYFLIMISLTMFFSGGMIPNFLLVNALNLIDTIWALVIPNAIWTIELLIIKSFFETLDKGIRESATIDGASEFRILFQIYIPLSKAALASVALFFFMGHWNSFFIPLVYLNDARKYPLTIVLRDMLIYDTAKESNMEDAARMTPEAMKNATIVVSMIPVLLVYPFAQKYFVKGVMLGSIKG
jgi:putative aldouronate transport system permease protein